MKVVRRDAAGEPPFPATNFSAGPPEPGAVIEETELDPAEGPLVIDGVTFVEVACPPDELVALAQGLRCSDELTAKATEAGCDPDPGMGVEIGLWVNGEQWVRHFARSSWGGDPDCWGETIAPWEADAYLAGVSVLVGGDYEFEAYSVGRAEPGFFYVVGQMPETNLAIEEIWLDLRPTNDVVHEVLTASDANGLVGQDPCPVCGPAIEMGISVNVDPGVGLTANQKLHILRSHRCPCERHDDQPIEVEEFGQTYRWWPQARSWVEGDRPEVRDC